MKHTALFPKPSDAGNTSDVSNTSCADNTPDVDNTSGADYIFSYRSPLGGITLASDGEALTGLWFDGQKYYGSNLSGACVEQRLPIFEQAEQWLNVYFSGRVPDVTPKLRMRTTAFRKAVWEILLTIPYGQTVTYGQIASILAARRGLSRMSAQAVGGAAAHNPIALIIPCHRVLGADRSLTGYAGGIERKAKLLELERGGISSLFNLEHTGISS